MVVLQSRSTRPMKLQYCTVHLVCFWVLTLSIFFCCTRQLNSLGLSSYDSCGLLWVVFSFCGQIFAFSCVNDFQRFPRDLHYTWQIGNIHFNSKKKKQWSIFIRGNHNVDPWLVPTPQVALCQCNSHSQYIDTHIQGYIMKHICWKEILTPGKEKIGDISEYSRSFQVFNYNIILIFKL